MADPVLAELNKLPASQLAAQMIPRLGERLDPQSLHLSQLLTLWLQKQPPEVVTPEEAEEIEQVLQATAERPLQLAAMLTPNYEETLLAAEQSTDQPSKVQAIAPFLLETYQSMLESKTFLNAGKLLAENLLNSREEVFPSSAPQHQFPSV